MSWKIPRPRFALRTLLVAVLVCAVGLAYFTSGGRWRTYRNQQARQRIDPYELSIAGDGNPRNVPPELVAILGDSRLKHWGHVGLLRILSGNRLASHGWDEKLRIWEIDTGRKALDVDAHSFTITGDRQTLFLVTTDGAIKRLDATSLKVSASLPAISGFERYHLATNKDGSILVCEALTSDSMREITAFDVVQSRVLRSFRPQSAGGGALAVSSDGKLFTWEDEGQVRLSNTYTGEVLQTFGPIKSTADGGRYLLGQVRFSDDDARLYVGSACREVVIFECKSGNEVGRIGTTSSGIHVFALAAGERLLLAPSQDYLRIFKRGHEKWETWRDLTAPRPGVAHVDHTDSVVAASHREGGISLWSTSFTPEIPWRLEGGPEHDVRCLAFHPHGSLATGSSTGEISCWEAGTWQRLRQWRGHQGVIQSLEFSRNGRTIASAGNDGVAVWDEETLRELVTAREFMFCPFVGLSADGKLAATSTYDIKGTLIVRSVADGKSVKKLGSLPTGIYGTPTWSPDGKRLVCNDISSTLYAFDVDTGTLSGPLGKSRFGQCKVRSVWFSDSQRLVTAGWGRDEVHLLEIGKATPVATMNVGGQVRWVALHPSEMWIAICGENTPVEIWHLPTSKLVKSWQIGPPKGVVHQVEFSPDGNYLATVNGNGTAYVLSLDGVLTE